MSNVTVGAAYERFSNGIEGAIEGIGHEIWNADLGTVIGILLGALTLWVLITICNSKDDKQIEEKWSKYG